MFSGAHKLEARGAGTKMWAAQTWGARTWGRSNRIPGGTKRPCIDKAFVSGVSTNANEQRTLQNTIF